MGEMQSSGKACEHLQQYKLSDYQLRLLRSGIVLHTRGGWHWSGHAALHPDDTARHQVLLSGGRDFRRGAESRLQGIVHCWYGQQELPSGGWGVESNSLAA